MEIKGLHSVERVVALICDICEFKMQLYDDPHAKLILDIPEAEWVEHHFCLACHRAVLEGIAAAGKLKAKEKFTETNGCSI